jgi:hypothetical protein
VQDNLRARELLDEAGGLPFGADREERLMSAIDTLGPLGGSGDDPEARGVALALLAMSDPTYLPAAEDALAAAREQQAETNWISVHLVDAYYRARDYGKVIEHAREVDQSYFDEEEDVHWRSVKVTELLAASLLAEGHLDEGLDLAQKVLGELARHGDDIEDILIPPYELALRALDMAESPHPGPAREAGYEILDAVAATLELGEWFPPSLVKRINRALAAKSG